MLDTVIRVAQKLKHINPGFMYNFNSLKKKSKLQTDMNFTRISVKLTIRPPRSLACIYALYSI